MSVHDCLYKYLLTKDVEFHYYFEDGEQCAIPVSPVQWEWFNEYVLFLAQYGK